jgi:hypothetical protein
VSFKAAQNVLGSFKFCTSKIEPIFAVKTEEAKDNKKGGEKKDNKKGGEKKDNKKDEGKDNAKSDKEAKEAERQAKLELELKAHDDKVKSWLEMECKFDFEEFKRTYCNAKPNEFKPVFEYLWKNFDDSQVSFYYLRFDKLPNELKNEIACYNKCQGFLDRTDSKAARAGFGIYNMWWDEKASEYEIRGLYLFKGTSIPYPFEIHQMLE